VVRADDFPATSSTAGSVAPGGTATGSVESDGDLDWFAVSLVAGSTYVFRLRGLDSGLGTLDDPLIDGIYDAAGNYIFGTFNDDYQDSLESQVTFTPTATGTYYLSASAYTGSIGTYQVAVSAGVSLDPPASTATAATVDAAHPYRGTISPSGDVDWVRAVLTAGTTYVIELNGDPNSSTPLDDPVLRGIYNSSGALIPGTSNDDYGTSLNSRVTFTPSTSGTYYFSAGGYTTSQGAYEMRLLTATTTTDPEANTTATTAVVPIGGSATGTINFARDVDWYRVQLTAGQTYEISARGSSSAAGTLGDPQIVGLYSATGAIIPGTGNDNAGSSDALTTFRPTATGTYYVAVNASNDGVGTYTVRAQVAATTGDLPANPTTGAVLAAGGTVSSAIEAAGDRDWIKVSLTAGTTYTIDLRGADSGHGTLDDPLIEGVFSAGGQAVASGDDDGGVGLNSRLTFTADRTGDYFLSVAGYQNHVGTYQARLTVGNGDTEAPTLLASSPRDNGTGVAPGSNLTLEFSEAVRAGNGNVVITGGGTTRTISVSDTTQVRFDGSTMTINPTANLLANTDYTVTMQSGAVKDVAGNAFAGISSTSLFNFRTGETSAGGTWTVMVYMAADNDLEPFAIADLNEMEQVTLAGNVRVRVLVDRSSGYDVSNGNWSDARSGFITSDGSITTVSSPLTSEGELNMGSATTLTNFINESMAAAPADNYALIVWNHGGGLSGTSWDDGSGGDNLTMAEFATGVRNSNVGRFDFIGFDACLQGMLEQAWDVRNLTDVLVASQELEPGDGWEYQTLLQSLANRPTMSAFDLGNAAIDAYELRYQGVPDTTLAAIRTSAIGALSQAVEQLVGEAVAAGTAVRSTLLEAASRATAIDGGSSDYRDLGDLMREIVSALPGSRVATAAQRVLDQLGDSVLSQTGTVPGATGLSVYLPLDAISSSYNSQGMANGSWGNFLRYLLDDQAANTLVSGSEGETLRGFGGNDALHGNDGDDYLDGGSGGDHMLGGFGNDRFVVDSLADVVTERSGRGADLVLSSISYSLVDTDGAGADGGNVEHLRLTGTRNSNATGNGLDNTLYVNNGVNVVDGRAGADTISFLYTTSSTSTGVTLDLGTLNSAGEAVASGGSGADRVRNIEHVAGSGYADVLSGDGGANTLAGAGGTDRLNGRGGADRLVGGQGADRLTGGSGADVFDYNSVEDSGVTAGRRDIITAFAQATATAAGDRIDLSGIDAVARTSANEGFTFIGRTAFSTTNAAGQLRYSFDSTTGIAVVQGSIDADAAAEFTIQVNGVSALRAADFLL
jgi:Ca2+-binding RTX toxin-like protein